jgi:hypothetical protein
MRSAGTHGGTLRVACMTSTGYIYATENKAFVTDGRTPKISKATSVESYTSRQSEQKRHASCVPPSLELLHDVQEDVIHCLVKLKVFLHFSKVRKRIHRRQSLLVNPLGLPLCLSLLCSRRSRFVLLRDRSCACARSSTTVGVTRHTRPLAF